MASFWERLKLLFGTRPPPADLRQSSDFLIEAFGVVEFQLKRGNQFTALQITSSALQNSGVTSAHIAQVEQQLEALFNQGYFTPFAYDRMQLPGGGWLYHPMGIPAAVPRASAPPPAAPKPPITAVRSAQPVVNPQPAPTAQPAQPAAKSPYRQSADPYAAAPGILGLSPDELRKRSLKIQPYATAWIGRVDTIPPQSDERTALIDRGLILRGLLSEQQIAEIHRVGDLWIQYGNTYRYEAQRHALANQHASQVAAEVLRERREEKAKKKAALAAESAEKARVKALDVARRRREDIVFLGRRVSHGLADRRANPEKLAALGLPPLATPADVARAMGLTIPALRWLCFHSDAAERTHYVYFTVPKRTGGVRTLASPHKKLAAAQRWVLDNVLAKLDPGEHAHGFVAGRSTLTNAAPHVGKTVVLNQDLEQFFPTVGFRRVRGLFVSLGYSPAVATVFALLCTEAPRQQAQYAGRTYWVAAGERALPQGACTSPALANQLARKLDKRLAGYCVKHGWSYTRYADDLTFSGGKEQLAEVGKLLAQVQKTVTDEGFKVHPKKTSVRRASRRQEVTGIVVNERPGLAREQVRRLRAILHGAEKTGLDAQNREGIAHFASWLRGSLAYLAMVQPERGKAMLAQLDKLEGRAVAQ